MANNRQNSIVSAGVSARTVSSGNARGRSPSSRCANASATANSVRMMVMLATWAARRTPAANAEGVERPTGQRLTESASSLERQATLRIATHGALGLPDLVGGVVPALRQRQLVCDSVGGEAAERVLPVGRPRSRAITSRTSAPLSTHRPLTTAADARSMLTRMRIAVARARLLHPPGQLLDELDETTPIDQKVAPRVLDHRFEITHSNGGRYHRERSLDGGLTTTVVQLAVVRGEEPEHVPRSIGEEPLIEGHDDVVSVLEPACRTVVQVGQPTG